MSQGLFERLPSDSFAGPLNEAIAASTAGGGTSLTTAATIVGLPNRTKRVSLIFRSFTTAIVAKFALNPFLMLLRSDNAGVTMTDSSQTGQQAPTADATGYSLSSLATLANLGVLYVGAHIPFRGVKVVMSASVNAVVSTLTAEYWNGTTWVSLAPTDGTAAGGATMAQSGNVTWTVPASTAWLAARLSDGIPVLNASSLPPATVNGLIPYNNLKYFWTRLSVSAALSANTKISQAFSLNRATTYAEALENSALQFRTLKAPGGLGAIEALTDAGTAKMIVDCFTDNPMDQF